MIGEMLDHFVGLFAPRAAARRVHARSVLRQVRRTYDAAKVDRTTSGWRAENRSADLEMLDAADTIRARARSLVRNNAYARGILRALTRNVVGCGITPEARIEGMQDTENAIESAWHRWQKRCDVTGRLSFYELQSLALSEVIEAGEVLIHFVESADRSRQVPLALELVEADRIATDWFPRGQNPETGNEVRRGVEVDATGRPVAYWIYEAHPTDLHSFRQVARRYPAEEFIHLFRQERIGQTRGVSAFAPVVRWLKDLHYYVENEMQSSAIASCFSVAVKTMGGPADGGLLDSEDSGTTDTSGNTFEYIQPGMVSRLMPGEDVSVINPARGHAESQAWIDLMLRSMAVGVGLSYERLSRDYSKTNYSSNRASDLEDRREFRPWQNWLITHLCEPVWERFIVACAEQSVPDMPSAIDLLSDYHKWTACEWNPPGWEWVDPVKEQASSQAAIAANQSTYSIECSKRGHKWRDILRQRIVERKTLAEMERAAGLQPVPSEQAQSAPEVEDEADDDSEGVDGMEEADSTEEEANVT